MVWLHFLAIDLFWSVFEDFCVWLYFYGWLPALIMAILCIVFSASLKEPNSKKYIILSCFNIAVTLVWVFCPDISAVRRTFTEDAVYTECYDSKSEHVHPYGI